MQSFTVSTQPQYEALDASGALVINQLSSVGIGFTVLCLMFIISLLVNYVFFRRISSLTDQLLNMVPTTTSNVLKAVSDFQESLKEVLKELREDR